MNIQKVKLSEIKNNPNNPRILKDDKFAKLVKSIQEFPKMLEIRPIVVNSDMIVLGGNMRLKACKEAGLKEVFIVKADDLTEDEQKQFIIKDNVGFGEWDWEMLANEWEADLLEEWGLDVPDFSVTEEPTAEEDDYDMPDEVQTDIVLGDLFEIGEHRLLCGDSTDSDQVAKLMNGEKADMVFTDPPYNTKMQQGRTSSNWGIIENDNMPDNDFANFCKEFVNVAYLFTKNEGHKYFCMGWSAYNLLFEAMPKVKNCIVWVKNVFGLGHNYRPQHEFILYDGGSLKSKSESNVWEEKKESVNKYQHPTQKPVTIPSRAIENSSKIGDFVLDIFLGSGSTMVAAHQLKRKCYGMELDPKYCQVIVDRMRKLDPTLVIKKNGLPL